MEKKIAVFPGSFDPFTLGHHSVVVRALPLFDEIVVAIGKNTLKNGFFSIDERIELIGGVYASEPKIKGLYQPPVVTAKLSNGEPLSSKLPAPNETIAKQEYDFTGQQSAILAAEHSEYMKKLCTAYINYVFNKDRSPERNFNYLSAYLLKNGEAYKQLYDFMGELRWNQQYTARKDNLLTAENFCHYSDSCFSCDTHFQMSLTKNEVSNDYEATVRWYMVETSDGWRAAKMEII